MRVHKPMLATCVLLLQRTTESTTTSGVQKTVAAQNVSAVPLRWEKFATVRPSRVKPQDAVAEVANDEDGDQEERMFPTRSSIFEGTHAMEGVERFSLPQARVSEILTSHAINEKIETIVTPITLRQWLYNIGTPGYSFGDDPSVKKLVQSGREGELVLYIHQLRGVAGIKGHADMMQKALLAEYPQAIPLAFNLWAESKVSIDETYHMMPISAVRSTLGAVGEKPSWPDSFPLLKHWLQFVYKHRSEDAGFSDGQVIDVLRRNRHVAEVVHFLDWLRNEPDMKMEAFVLLPTLAVKLSKSAELEPLFGAWLKLKVNPVEAYHRMGISGEKRFGYVLSMIKDWVYYLRKYRSEVGGFGDDQVVQVLTDDRDRVDCLKIFMWLRFLPGMKEDADLFQRSLILGSSDPAEMLQLVFDVWQKSKVSPEEVYKVVPISTEDGTFGTLREGSDPPITYRLHKCWVRYLGKHQSEVDGFGDDKAIGILLKDRPDVGEVVNFLNWLRDEPGMKMHADLLQRALIARFWESAKILELVFGAWQKTKVSFDEAYHMMPTSAVRSTSGAVGGKPSWRDSFPFLKHWLQFMYKHRSEDAGFSEGQVIDVLLRNQNVVEVVDFLIWLRNESGMKACADLLLKTLFFKLSESTKELKLVFVAWQRNKVSLDDAYHMLPNSATQNLGGDAGLQSSSSGDFGVLKAWLDHLYKLPGDNLRDDRVAELLVSNRPKAELEKLCEVLNYQPKTRKLAVTLKKKVALRWPVL